MSPWSRARFPSFRVSEPFERVRAEAARTGARIFLAAIGPPSAHSRRLGFAREFFEAGGVSTIAGAGADSVGELAETFRQSGAAQACLCGSDEDYARSAVDSAEALKSAGVATLYLAGRPGDSEAKWRAAGIDDFIYAGADLIAVLEGLLHRVRG